MKDMFFTRRKAVSKREVIYWEWSVFFYFFYEKKIHLYEIYSLFGHPEERIITNFLLNKGNG